MFNFFKKKKKEKELEKEKWFFQRSRSLVGDKVVPDPIFQTKVSSVLRCIKEKNMESIEEIAKDVDCSYEECLKKIKYLKNKKVLDDYYINTKDKLIKKLSEEESQLLKKYRDSIYLRHYKVVEIAYDMRSSGKTSDELKEEIFNDIKFLFDKEIISGINLDYDKKEIIYLDLEKKKQHTNFLRSVTCPKCGALIEVPKGGSIKCEYCDSIVEDTKEVK